MFFFKKVVKPFFLPPGFFVVVLIILGVVCIKKKQTVTGILQIVLALILWSISIPPVVNMLIANLEHEFPIPEKITGDCIILLGGGCLRNVPDLTGEGLPNGETSLRMITAIRLHHRLGIPIIVSSGVVMNGKMAGADVIKRVMVDLGVPEKMIIVEGKSRDTYENALFSKKICDERGFSSPILVTAAYHLKRAHFIFSRVGLKTTPFPAYRRTAIHYAVRWHHFLPTAKGFATFYLAAHEMLGLTFYRLAY